MTSDVDIWHAGASSHYLHDGLWSRLRRQTDPQRRNHSVLGGGNKEAFTRSH